MDSNKNIIWTIEWIGADKSRTLTQTSAVEPIYRAHPLFESGTQKKKRKKDAEAPSTSDVKTPANKPNPASQMEEVDDESLPTTAVPSEPGAKTGAGNEEAQQPDPSQADSSMDGRYDFYLLRPRTSSSRHVLIPLNASATLSEALQGSTVLEFPTIHYFPSTTPELPKEFMLDQDYQKEEGEQQKEFEEMMQEVDPEILKRLRNDATSSTADEQVDSKKILDVLKQDLGAL